MDVGEQLAGWGKAALLETRGAGDRSGSPRATSASSTAGRIASSSRPGDGRRTGRANLLADPACTVTIGERSFRGVAEPLAGGELATAIRELILRYGTPAERLGHGPAFRLRPVAAAGGPA